MEIENSKKRAGRPKKSTEETLNVKNVDNNAIQENLVEENTPINNTESKAGKRISRNFKENIYNNLDKKRVVPVVSVVSHPVGYNCKLTNLFIKWNEYGDEHLMSIEEVLIMNGEDNVFLHDPLLIVDDEEFAELMNLDELYSLIFEIEDLSVFYSNQKINIIENKLDKLPNNTRRNLLERTIKMITSGELDNYGVVKLLKKKYNVDLDI